MLQTAVAENVVNGNKWRWKIEQIRKVDDVESES
jgi:hypothetical protein